MIAKGQFDTEKYHFNHVSISGKYGLMTCNENYHHVWSCSTVIHHWLIILLLLVS